MDPTNPIATISRGDVGRVIDHEYIQHEANITPGSSGSPLLVSGPTRDRINYAGVGDP
jgi:V8-like Glu-specific endopeptidase